MIKLDFGSTFGIRSLSPFYLEEMRDITYALPSLKRTGFFIGGMDWFSNWISFPLAMTWYLLFPSSDPGWIRKMIYWGMRKFSRPPFYTHIRAECKGKKAGKNAKLIISLEHVDGYVFTAIPVIATLHQYFKQRKPGLWKQATYVEPLLFIKDITSMGIHTNEVLLET